MRREEATPLVPQVNAPRGALSRPRREAPGPAHRGRDTQDGPGAADAPPTRPDSPTCPEAPGLRRFPPGVPASAPPKAAAPTSRLGARGTNSRRRTSLPGPRRRDAHGPGRAAAAAQLLGPGPPAPGPPRGPRSRPRPPPRPPARALARTAPRPLGGGPTRRRPAPRAPGSSPNRGRSLGTSAASGDLGTDRKPRRRRGSAPARTRTQPAVRRRARRRKSARGGPSRGSVGTTRTLFPRSPRGAGSGSVWAASRLPGG